MVNQSWFKSTNHGTDRSPIRSIKLLLLVYGQRRISLDFWLVQIGFVYVWFASRNPGHFPN